MARTCPALPLVELWRGPAAGASGTCISSRDFAKMAMLFFRCRWSSRQLEVAAMPGGQTQMAVPQKNLGTGQKISLMIRSQIWTMLGIQQRLRASWCH